VLIAMRRRGIFLQGPVAELYVAPSALRCLGWRTWAFLPQRASSLGTPFGPGWYIAEPLALDPDG
jgi:hypothetical protein